MRNPGKFPHYGAIFMANNSTRKECFERELFGLPCEYADFVREVKVGMLLFLFDFQERKLYGVFKATSDGMMNIIPNAYNSTSKKKFPAQVRFSTLWHCNPLPEPVFFDAIKENYFQQFKFNLGLSRNQVGKLLFLFQENMLKVPRPHGVREKQQQRSSHVEKSVVASPRSLEISSSMQESFPSEGEDYIPLPSIEPEELDDLSEGLLWEAGLSSILPLAAERTDEDGKTDDNGLPVQGLYSDKQRTSAFLRLSGLGKVLGEERHHHSKVDDVRDILKVMDETHRLWVCKSTENTSISRVSVFSRLSCDVGKASESQKKVRAVAGEMKSMDVPKEVTCQNLKLTSSCSEKRLTSGNCYDDLRGKQRGKALGSLQKVEGVGDMKAVDIAKDFIHQTLKCKRTSCSKKSAKDLDNLSAKQHVTRFEGKHSRKRPRFFTPSPSVAVSYE